jgi:hypothetical protein
MLHFAQSFGIFLKFICCSQKFLGAGGVAQVVACLPSKHRALCSNSSTEKKKFLPPKST